MLHVEAYRHQYGVGQGCFHVQTLEFSGEKTANFTYRFVYDCGGSPNQSPKTLDWCIDHATSGSPSLDIDAVYLSHFEEDHVNGIEKLCLNANVSRIYAPHIDFSTAVHIIAQQLAGGASWTVSYQEFVSTLFEIAGGGDIFGIPVTLIRGGENPPDGPEPFNDNDLLPGLSNDGQLVKAVTPTGSSVSHSVRIPVVVTGQATSARSAQHQVVWEMVHWYYGSDAQLTQQILNQIGAVSGYSVDCQPGLQANSTPAQVKAALRWIKDNHGQIADAYILAMGAFNAVRAAMVPPQPPFLKGHNIASLCLYSGPVGFQSYLQNPNNWSCYLASKLGFPYWVDPRIGAWIATGDAMLGVADVWNEFIAHFGVSRIEACATVMIPHHGADAASSHNFNDELIREGQNCVISAGSKNGYRHPHRNVVQAIMKKPATLQLVTESNPMGFVEHLVFYVELDGSV